MPEKLDRLTQQDLERSAQRAKLDLLVRLGHVVLPDPVKTFDKAAYMVVYMRAYRKKRRLAAKAVHP